MDLIEGALQFKGSEHLEQFTRKKMYSVFSKTSEVMRAEVTLYEGGGGTRENQFCEITLNVLGSTIMVKKNATAYEQAIRLAVSAIEKIIRRQKKQG